MSSPTYIGIALAVFVVTALLYFQSIERFEDVPADLNKAPVSRPVERMPPFKSMTSPGAPPAPKEAIATRSELAELDSKLTTWLDAASQRELENPAALTMDQREMRVMFQGRISAIRQQLGTGIIVDKSKAVAAEILKMRKENAGWQHVYPTLGAVSDFAIGSSDTAMLTNDQYAEFRGIMLVTIQKMKDYPTSEPLDVVRLKQLEVINQELSSIDKQNRIPLIRVGVARTFLQLMDRPTQPLPSLMSIEGIYEKSLIANPMDVIRQVQIIPNPPQELIDLAAYLSTGKASQQHVIAARAQVAAAANSSGPNVLTSSVSPLVSYNPDYLVRATRLCKEIRQAFPDDAESLGCGKAATTEDAAETQIYTVCQRIRESVPSVTPEQFNCPKRSVY